MKQTNTAAMGHVDKTQKLCLQTVTKRSLEYRLPLLCLLRAANRTALTQTLPTVSWLFEKLLTDAFLLLLTGSVLSEDLVFQLDLTWLCSFAITLYYSG